MITPKQTRTYRFDLDGLRGLAIAGVVFFHVFVGKVSGGVDVFLLLSGFFFLGSLFRNAERYKQSINPWWSIWRTIRRLYPSLILTIGTISVASFYLTPGLITGDIVRQVVASVLYFQNYELARQGADYAAATTQVSPLQHLWSMSVQGQFYLAAIITVSVLAWILRKERPANPHKSASDGRLIPSAAVILAAITVASFVRACYLGANNQSFNYYATSSRLWELTLGGLLALVMPYIRVPRLAARLLAPLGLVMVLSTGVILDGASQFPGPWALWPIVGAAFIIIAGPQTRFISPILASRPMTFLGGIAYSLYLWHWPLLIMATIIFDQKTPSIPLGIAVIAVSVVLAWLTNVCVEKPLQQSKRRPTRVEPVFYNAWDVLRKSHVARTKAVAGIAVATVACALVGSLPWYQHLVNSTISSKIPIAEYPGVLAISDNRAVPKVKNFQPNPKLIRDIWPQPAVDGCITMGDEPADEIISTRRWSDDGPCIYGDPKGDKTITLIGGSHSEHWFAPLNAAAKAGGYRLQVILRQGCPPMLSPIDGVGDICIDWTNAVLDELEANPPEAVITTSTRPGQGEAFANNRADYTPAGYTEFWDAVNAKGIKVIGIRDTPWAWDENDELYEPTKCLVSKNLTGSARPVGDACAIERRRVMAETNDAERYLSDSDNRLSVDFTDYLCTEEFCPAVIGNIFVFRDSNHITDEIAASMSIEMQRKIIPFLRH